MDDLTTHKVDYIPHPLEKPYHHHGDTYKAPEGEMDMNTNYLMEFTKKPFEPVKAIRRDEVRKVPGKFEGEPTYQADYRKWGLQPRERVTADYNYQPPTAPFDGNTNYQADFIPHAGAQRQSMKPREAPRVSDQPFDDNTDYKQSYIKHPLQPREVKDKPIWKPNEAPLDDLSHYRKDYTPKEGYAKAQSCKPDAAPYKSTAPFEGDTTQKADFVPWDVQRPRQKEQEAYRKPEGEMDMNTTTHTDYVRKAMERQPMVRPQEARKATGKFDGTTNYQMEYQKWGLAERQKHVKEAYVPNEAPFDGMPTYQRDYVQHQGTKAASMKPIDLGYSSNAPLEDGTEYKKEFTKKWVPPCPIPLLESGQDIGYTYREQDTVGHKWYDLQSMAQYHAALAKHSTPA